MITLLSSQDERNIFSSRQWCYSVLTVTCLPPPPPHIRMWGNFLYLEFRFQMPILVSLLKLQGAREPCLIGCRRTVWWRIFRGQYILSLCFSSGLCSLPLNPELQGFWGSTGWMQEIHPYSTVKISAQRWMCSAFCIPTVPWVKTFHFIHHSQLALGISKSQYIPVTQRKKKKNKPMKEKIKGTAAKCGTINRDTNRA